MTIKTIENFLPIDPNNEVGERAVFQASASCKGNGDKQCGFFQSETVFPDNEHINLGHIAYEFKCKVLGHEVETGGEHTIEAKIRYRLLEEE